MPMCSFLAIMPLVIGGPLVKFCQSSLKRMSLYLPVFGRCFSSSWSSLITTPPVTVLVVVFCVPMPMVTSCCARAGSASANDSADRQRAMSRFMGSPPTKGDGCLGRRIARAVPRSGGDLKLFALGRHGGPVLGIGQRFAQIG